MFAANVVGGVESNKAGQKAPATEESAGERGDLCACRRTVEGAPGEMRGLVALDRVPDGEGDDLDFRFSVTRGSMVGWLVAVSSYHKEPIRQKTGGLW